MGFVVLWRFPNGDTNIGGFVHGFDDSILIDGKWYVVRPKDVTMDDDTPVNIKLGRFPWHRIKINGKKAGLKRASNYYYSESTTPKKIFDRKRNRPQAKG